MHVTLNSINTEAFTPPFWAANPHIQTIFPSLFDTTPEMVDDTLLITTPDDDIIEIDIQTPDYCRASLIILHGLEGSSRRFYVKRLIKIVRQYGFRTCAMNFRSCASAMNRQRRMYHSGETKDLSYLIDYLLHHYKEPLFLAGFSLGGNVVQCYLGGDGSEKHISAAAVISAPYNLKASSIALQQGFNRVYEKRFIKMLLKKVDIKRKQFSDFPEFSGSTLYDFDDQITAPLHGFKNAETYYSTCSSNRVLSDIETPMLVIHSEEDPICPITSVPVELLTKMQNVKLIVTQRGGHVGYITKEKDQLENTIIEFFNGFL